MRLEQMCQELAKAVLEELPQIDDADRRSDLAQNIQQEVEAWVSAELASLEPR